MYRYEKGRLVPAEYPLPVEDELEIVVNDRVLARLAYTPGHEAVLGLGYLWNQGFFERLADVAWGYDAKRRRFCLQVEAHPEARVGLRSSACASGLTFGRRVLRRLPKAVVEPELPFHLLRQLHAASRQYKKTRGIHAAALFDLEGRLLLHFEDVGRHNALDRLAGAVLLEGLEGPFTLAATGRFSREMAEKAIHLGAVLAATRTGATDQAVRIAEAFGLTVAAYVRPGSYRVYAHPERFSRSSGRLTLAKTASPKRARTSAQGR
jgi:FdhD protein